MSLVVFKVNFVSIFHFDILYPNLTATQLSYLVSLVFRLHNGCETIVEEGAEHDRKLDVKEQWALHRSVELCMVLEIILFELSVAQVAETIWKRFNCGRYNLLWNQEKQTEEACISNLVKQNRQKWLLLPCAQWNRHKCRYHEISRQNCLLSRQFFDSIWQGVKYTQVSLV